MANKALPASGPKLGEQPARFTIRKTGFPDNYTLRADPSAPTPITTPVMRSLFPIEVDFREHAAARLWGQEALERLRNRASLRSLPRVSSGFRSGCKASP